MQCPYCGSIIEENASMCPYCGNVVVKMKQSKVKNIAIIGSICLFLLCLGAGIFLVNSRSQTRKYQEKISLAEKYMANEDYMAAITAYNEALEYNEDNPELYEQLALAYEKSGNTQMADTILTRGYQITRAQRLKDLLNNLLAYGSLVGGESLTTELAVGGKENQILIADALVSQMINYGYRDYQTNVGVSDGIKEGGGAVSNVDVPNLGITLVYVNGSAELFDNEGTPKGNTKPSYIRLHSMSVLFPGFEDRISYEKLCELFQASPEICKSKERDYISVIYCGCTLQIETDENGNIISNSAWNKLIEPGAGEDEKKDSNTGTASGKIVNAVSGQGISNVKLSVREGTGNRDGKIIEEVEADDQGNYAIEQPEGRYTLYAEADGYTSEYFEINIIQGMTMSGQNFSMSGGLAQGECRIVLEWGSDPADLDSHLFANNEHIYFGYLSGKYASLDLDDRSAYGPETITVYDIGSGSYTYGVHDFTNAGNFGSTALSASGATVKVYMGGASEPKVYQVPSGAGTYWEVFKIENGAIKDINQMREGL